MNQFFCIRWPKYWSFSIRLSNEYSGLISLRIDWLDPLEVQGTQESSPTPQFKSMNSLAVSLLYGPAFTSIHDYWKNHSFEYMDICQQLIPLLFNTLSRFLIPFLPRITCLLTSWFQSPSAVTLKPKKIKSVTVSIFPHLFSIR